MYMKSLGLSKVWLRYNQEAITPFQPIKEEDVILRYWFNRFTYEDWSDIYDIEVQYDGKITYYQNMKVCKKNKYHAKIEEFYKKDIEQTKGLDNT